MAPVSAKVAGGVNMISTQRIPGVDEDTTRCIDRVRGEYREMPGLSLTPDQAARLWGMERQACQTVLEALVGSGFLRRTSGGGYVRADRG
jgi:hypothetical protein